jgi:hypothetical protein
VKAKYAPGERDTRLYARDGKIARGILGHRRQQANLDVLTALIERLHGLKTPTDFYELHSELVHRVHEADNWAATCAERELLIRGGTASDPGPAADWELERIVADRIARQLRVVGDGLAWKALNYSRPLVVALASNRGKPDTHAKAGFLCELKVLKASWENDGHFAFLHDATNSLTIADISVCSALHAPHVDPRSHSCNDERYLLTEVKNRKGRCMTVRRGAQLAKMQMAVDAIVNDQPVVGRDGKARRLFKSSLQFKTRLGQVSGLIDQASRTGYAVGKLQRGWVLSARVPFHPVMVGTDTAALRAAEDEALDRAGFSIGRHRFVVSTADSLAKSPDLAPFSIYPFQPETCAAMICDYLVLVSVLEITAVSDALLRAGFSAVHAAPSIDLSQSDQHVVIGVVGRRGMSINGSALLQIMFEFLDLKRQADAMKEYAAKPRGPFAIGILTLQNERATWR